MGLRKKIKKVECNRNDKQLKVNACMLAPTPLLRREKIRQKGEECHR